MVARSTDAEACAESAMQATPSAPLRPARTRQTRNNGCVGESVFKSGLDIKKP